MLYGAGTASSAPLRANKLREETPVGQAALKVMNLQGKVVTLYYRRPSCFFLSQARCGEIDLFEDGQPARFKRSAHHRWAHEET